jgi:ABC-type iron transport system FetAB permease component
LPAILPVICILEEPHGELCYFTALREMGSMGSLCGSCNAGRDSLEQWLLLGASRWEATHGLIQKATMAALAPTLSHISVTGLVTIPSAMAGQLLGGSAPVQVR